MKSYQFLPEYHNAIASLTDEQYGRIMRAVNEYVFSGEEPRLEGIEYTVWCLAFNRLRMSCSRSHSNAGAPKGSRNNPLGRAAKTNQELIKNKSKTNQKLIKNKSNVADTQAVTSIISSELVNDGLKEQENKEENTPSSPMFPQTPSLTTTPLKEEKKEIEKKERYEREDEQEGMTEEEFFSRMKVYYPRVMSMNQPLTYAEYKRLVQEYGYSVTLIKDILGDMENYADLHKKFISANRTLHKWIKIRQRR